MSAFFIAAFLVIAAVGCLFAASARHTGKMERDFAALFPGKCIICAFHRFGRREGLTSEPAPVAHSCIEQEGPNGPATPLDGSDPQPEGAKEPCRAFAAVCSPTEKEGEPR